MSLSYAPNNTAPLLGGSISAEVGVWQSKLQPKDMSYSSSAARQWHPRLAPADRAASHRGAVRCSPLPPAISFWQALSSVSLGCLYCIDQAFFFSPGIYRMLLECVRSLCQQLCFTYCSSNLAGLNSLKQIWEEQIYSALDFFMFGSTAEVYWQYSEWHSGSSVLKLVYWLTADISFHH